MCAQLPVGEGVPPPPTASASAPLEDDTDPAGRLLERALLSVPPHAAVFWLADLFDDVDRRRWIFICTFSTCRFTLYLLANFFVHPGTLQLH